MTITPTYPGVYIQELPSLTHAVTPSPTSIAVFVGYTHPFATPPANYGPAIQLFGVQDYLTNFGGFFESPWLTDYVGQAVWQFFLNGGPSCYVVALKPDNYNAANGIQALVDGNVTFTALQPVGAGGQGIAMQVAFSNIRASKPAVTPEVFDTADVVVSYGTASSGVAVETYRKVTIPNLASTLSASSLVQCAVDSTTTAYAPPPTAPTVGPSPFTVNIEYGDSTSTVNTVAAPAADTNFISPAAFALAFEDGAPLDTVPTFNLLVTPGILDYGVMSEAVAYCERKRAFYIIDTPSSDTTGWDAKTLSSTPPDLTEFWPTSINAAAYYPWLQMNSLVTNAPIKSPPSGFVAGMYGTEDAARGVWKSPAGIETSLFGTPGVVVSGLLTDAGQGVLNGLALDCIRQFAGIGTVIFGARTTAGADTNTAQQQWKYVAVRRMALFLEQSLYANLNWAVFEPNSQPLWDALTQEVNAFMLSLFRQGAFAGDTPSDSFVVVCDGTTTTPTDVAAGTVNILVGFAPLVPAEFVVVQIAQLAGQAQT